MLDHLGAGTGPVRRMVGTDRSVWLCGVRTDWTGLDWTGLDWTGLDWTGRASASGAVSAAASTQPASAVWNLQAASRALHSLLAQTDTAVATLDSVRRMDGTARSTRMNAQ